ncbi:MAG: nucleotide pyrophosphohydrolase [Saprospiraceae bacterium]|nr:nucleotide pyrophosphohydrolase [Saprospiraceae bacterium]
MEQKEMTLSKLQLDVDQWIKLHGVRYFSELTNMALLTEECGEVARLMARIYGEQSFKSEAESQHARESLASEMADVLFVLTCLANQCGVDLEQAIVSNMEAKGLRDGPRHHNNPKLK